MGKNLWGRLTALLAISLLHIAPCQAETEPHLQRASQLILAGQLEKACDELLLSYQVSHDSVLFLRIGRLQQRLGHLEAARQAYARFLAESGPATTAMMPLSSGPHPALKAEAEQALRALNPPPPKAPDLLRSPKMLGDSPLPPPGLEAPGQGPLPLVSTAPAMLHRPRRNARLMKIGGLLFAAGYLPALIIPLALSTSLDHESAPSPASNYTLLIPLVGPVVSGIVAPATNSAGHGAQVFSSWSAPWMLTSGLLQITGFTLFVAGTLGKGTTI